jgi:hypothetical protein
MHRCTVITVQHSCYAKSQSTRAITPYCVRLLINPFLDVCLPRPRWTVVMCLARLQYLWRPSVINILYLHGCGACPSSLYSTILPSIPHFPLMSHTNPTPAPSNFQLIFNNALKAYKKRTKNDLLTHPLADRLKACDSASSIRTVLQEQVQELNRSERSNTEWLDPTVNVIQTFSETLGEVVGSVCFRS